MKYNRSGVFAAALAAAAIASVSAVTAATLYWDAGLIEINGISDGGAGTWAVAQPGWEDGTSAQNWTDGSSAAFNGVAGTVTLGGPVSAAGVTFQTTGYTLALANSTLAVATLNYSGANPGGLTVTGTAGTASSQNTLSIAGPGTGWVAGTVVNLNGSANPAVGSTQNGALAKLTLGNAGALGAAEIKVKHGLIQAGAPGITIPNNITNGGASIYFGGENDFAVSGLVKNDSTGARTLGVWSGATGSRTITLGDVNNNGQTVNFEARGLNANAGGGFVVNGVISGTGGVSTVGTGQFAGNIVTLNGANTYTGATTMFGGRLKLNGSVTSAITMNTGATLSGTGSTSALLTMNAGSRLALAGGATTTSLTASAGVNFAGAPVVVFDSTPVASTVYDVLTYGAGPVTNPANLKVGYRGTLANTGTKFTFTAGAFGQTRTWNVTDGTWDIGTSANWAEDDHLFYNGDTAIFNNPAAASTVTLSGVLLPASVTVNNTAPNTYTFAGTGSISGAASLAKSGSGALAIASQQSYTGGTTLNGGVLDLTGGGGVNGVIRGAIAVSNGGTLKLSTGDATGYGGGATALTSINLIDSTLHVNSTANQTLGSAAVTMTGSTISGIAGSNLDFFGNGSSLTTLPSPNSSIISLPTFNLRQDNTVFTIADGAAADDLLVSSSIGNGAGGNHSLIKNGAGTIKLTGLSVFTGNVTVNGGTLDLTSGGLFTSAFNNSSVVTANAGGLVKLGSFGYSGTASFGMLRDYAQQRVLNGGAFEVTAGSESVGSDFTVAANGGVFRYNPALASSTLTLTGNANTNIPLAGTLTFRTDGNITVNEILEGAGGVIKTGNQTLTYTANNSYTGDTTVSEGTLALVGGSQASAITVGNGAKLGLSVDSPATSTKAVALGAGSSITIIGTPVAPADYTLLTAASITGTPVLGTPIAGYSLEIQGGNTLVLKSSGGSDFSNWIDGFTFDPGADKSATGDPDGDGLTNFEEYAFGLEPNNGASVNPIVQPLDKASGLFQYTRRNPSATGIGYTYQSSTDLVNWTAFTADAENPITGDPVQTVTVDVPDALLSNAKLFIRVLAN